KRVPPHAGPQEQAGWRELLFVHALPFNGDLPKLSKRQKEIWHIIEERRELPLKELLEIADTAASTIRRLEDKGLVAISAQISERDPYGREHFLPTQPLPLNPPQARALDAVISTMDQNVTQQLPESLAKVGRGVPTAPVPLQQRRGGAVGTPRPTTSRPFLLHGVTGSGKTEVYLQAIAHALKQGKGAMVLVPEISLTPQTVERLKARFSPRSTQTLLAVLHSHLSAGERHDEWHKIRQSR